MPAIVLIGAQWGDEGKGKATDLLGSRVDYVVKFNGGNNAGHTVVVGDQKYALHLLPSGILTDGVVPVIANGVVVDIEVLFHELEALTSRGARCVAAAGKRERARHHAVSPHPRQGDRAVPRQTADRHHRAGHRTRLRGQDQPGRHPHPGPLRREHPAAEGRGRPRRQEPHAGEDLQPSRAIAVDEVVEDLLSYADRLRPMVADTGLELNRALDAGKTVLFEGGQATMLDVDHGTYPFVTSSNATSGGAATGSGVAPNRFERVIAVVKAYTTRVGSGPFPTELFDESGEFLRANGFEFGTTTGRPRRCGWYDAPVARYAARINGVTDFVLTKLDVLTGLATIPVCVAYDIDGVRVDEVPVSQSDFHHAVPIYEEFPGWTEDITGARSFDDLPANAQAYVLALEKMSGSRISAIGVGPDREAIVVRHDLLG